MVLPFKTLLITAEPIAIVEKLPIFAKGTQVEFAPKKTPSETFTHPLITTPEPMKQKLLMIQ